MTEKEKLESKLEKLKSEIDAKYNVYLSKRNRIIEEIHTIEADEAKAAVGETYYEKLVHVTSKCSDGRAEHFIGGHRHKYCRCKFLRVQERGYAHTY